MNNGFKVIFELEKNSFTSPVGVPFFDVKRSGFTGRFFYFSEINPGEIDKNIQMLYINGHSLIK